MTDIPTPSFSVLIAEQQAQLKTKLQAVQAWTLAKQTISDDVENKIKSHATTIKVLCNLKKDGWQLAFATQEKEPHSTIYIQYDYRQDQQDHSYVYQLSNDIIAEGIAGDLLEIEKAIHGDQVRLRGYNKTEDVFIIAAIYYWLTVKAKHLPLIPYDNLKAVQLSDGNTAWLTPETLKTVREVIDSK